MDWSNVDLNSPSERASNLIDGKTFDIFLLEVSCNINEPTPEAITQHFNETIEGIVREAKEVFKDNLDAIVKDVLVYKNMQ